MSTKAREVGGSVDCIPIHSMRSFLFNALMSCSTESSRTESKIMMVAENYGGGPVEALREMRTLIESAQ